MILQVWVFLQPCVMIVYIERQHKKSSFQSEIQLWANYIFKRNVGAIVHNDAIEEENERSSKPELLLKNKLRGRTIDFVEATSHVHYISYFICRSACVVKQAGFHLEVDNGACANSALLMCLHFVTDRWRLMIAATPGACRICLGHLTGFGGMPGVNSLIPGLSVKEQWRVDGEDDGRLSWNEKFREWTACSISSLVCLGIGNLESGYYVAFPRCYNVLKWEI